MCFECQRRWREEHAKAMRAATEHMDAAGVDKDSLLRGLAEVQLACNGNPILSVSIHTCWPGQSALMQ